MSIFIKICGICSRSDLEQICALGPDAVGFVFWPKSARYVRPEQVAHWIDSIPESVKKVGVFVEPLADFAEETARICQLDVIQIHLKSNEWKIDRPLFQGLEIWLSPRMGKGVSSSILEVVSPEPAVLLADAFDPDCIGGTGRLGSWERAIAMRRALGKPILLAGGLTGENVSQAIADVQPWGVDVSSGVETAPGVKDIRKVAKFIEKVRA